MLTIFSSSPTTNAMPTITATFTSNTTNTSIPSVRRRKGKVVISFMYHYISLMYEFVYTLFIVKPKQHLLSNKQHSSSSSPSTSTSNNNNNNTTSTSTTTTTTTLLDNKQHTKSIHPKKALQYYKGKTLVLDLDETLVHSVRLGSQEANITVNPSIKRKQIEVQNEKQSFLYEVYKRPHVDFFLKTISQWYKVVIFTASMSEYADPVIDWLDQDQTMVSHRYFRQSCVARDGNYLKDISLAESDLSKVCLVDNSPIAYDLFKDNGIQITSWISSANDECLLDLLPLLDALRFTSDVRSILRLQRFGL
ncbi:NLI interacting factor-like phosphatase-domain-containing protein [Cunninghamella echinulata]|nr:NLI interacting factor-like phosphatase-domain-containing protein [Cunninghamella echinulata]